MTLAFYSPGPLEMIIVAVMAFGPLVAVGVLLYFFLGHRKPNPNLIPCPDCGRHISRSAVACPGCGRPMTPQDTTT